MKRLKRLAEEDDMTFDEVKEEVIQGINKMESLVNEWSIRDILCKFTEWSFYQGEEMASIDEIIAMDICTQLLKYVNTLTKNDEDILFEIDDKVGRYAY
jgi:uncharacterized protein YjgD (DUF1641 family)